MKVLLQRVGRAEVRVDGRSVGRIGRGLLVFVGVERGDDEAQADWHADKAAELRIFPDDDHNMNRSLLDVGGEALVVSQFTLASDTRKGRRPSFVRAAAPDDGKRLYDRFALRMAERGITVATGIFRATMEVELVNDGPVTILLDSPTAIGHGSDG